MLAAPLSIHTQEENGPRAIDLPRDSKQVVELLDIVFGPLLDAQGHRRIGDRISFDYTSPFVPKLNVFSSKFVPSFVWEENGQIVGNVSLVKSQLPGRFLIANVAVHPDFRRRGFARMLMEVAIEHVGLREGREIFLQVRNENAGATLLYEKLGFEGIGSVKNWQTKASRLSFQTLSTPVGRDIRPLRKREWRSAFVLDSRSADPNLMWPTPISSKKYQRGALRRFEDFINGVRHEIWIKEVAAGNDKKLILAGLANIWSEWGRAMKLELRVHPKFRGSIEPELLTKGLSRLKSWRGGTIRIRHPADDETTNQFLSDMSFKETHSLLVMKLELI